MRPGVPVAMTLCDDDGSFAVDVIDEGPYDAAPQRRTRSTSGGGFDGMTPAEPDALADGLPSGVVLAVISGLVDAVTIAPGPGKGTRVHMEWPAGRVAMDTQTLSESALT